VLTRDASLTVRAVVGPALQTLRAYLGTTILLVATCAVGLAAALPVLVHIVAHGTHLAPNLALPPVADADVGVAWSAFAQSPNAVRQAAVAALLKLLLGVTVGVLAVTSLTTLCVSTARADARETEIGVRRAVGASRRSLLAAVLLEGGMVAALALAAGCGGGLVAARVATAAWPGTAGPPALGLSALAVGATLGGVMLGALFPLIFARRSSQIAVGESSPVGLAIPAAQLGLSLSVLATAALLNRGAERVTAAEGGGAAPGQVYQVTSSDSQPAARAAAYDSLLRRLHRHPGVVAASLSSPGALTGLGTVDFVWSTFSLCTPGFRTLPLKACPATHYVVSADTFGALGLRLVAGRGLNHSDSWGAPRVAVISRSLTFPLRPADAVGLTLRVGHEPLPYTVVGVVDDPERVGIGGGFEPRFAVYLSVLQHPAAPADLLLRTARESTELDAVVSSDIAATMAALAPTVRMSEADLLEAEVKPLQWFVRLFTAEGWTVLTVATIGTFAMMWLWVSSLLGEVGVRRAVGARRLRIMAYVLARALLVAAGGVTFGSWFGMMMWDAVSGIVSGLPSWDPGAVARLGLLLAAAAVLGAWLPAHRATHTVPARLLSS
jgi:hypothetical protein